MTVPVAEPCAEHDESAQREEVDDDHPRGIVNSAVEVPCESGQGKRDGQTGELHEHVCG